jgi:hypothetical protein
MDGTLELVATLPDTGAVKIAGLGELTDGEDVQDLAIEGQNYGPREGPRAAPCLLLRQPLSIEPS